MTRDPYVNYGIIHSPYGKNLRDDIIYTIIYFHWQHDFQGAQEAWDAITANMWHNYNETFRDLLITWLNINWHLYHHLNPE